MTHTDVRRAETVKRLQIFRSVLRVKEVFLFDAKPGSSIFVGYRLHKGAYRPIPPDGGRLTSKCLGLQLIRQGGDLRLAVHAGSHLLTPAERLRLAEEEMGRLQRENEELRRRLGGQ
jgi:hypothetical protein